MNDKEWVLEYKFRYGWLSDSDYIWKEATNFSYNSEYGIVDPYNHPFKPRPEVTAQWENVKDQYRLRHIPTGKIIPGDLL